MKQSIVSLFVLMSLSGYCLAQGQSMEQKMAPLKYEDSGSNFFDDKERGWHWYEQPLEDEEAEEPIKAEKPPEEKKPEEKKQAAPAGPAPMSAQWLRDNLPKYLMKAVDEPSEENVRAYLYLQRYSMDKAQNYAKASQRVTMNDPYLDQNTRRPMSGIGTDAAGREGLKVRNSILKDLAKTTGIMFFFRGDCSFCHDQWPLLKEFARRYGFTVMPISMDGGVIDGMDPKEVQLDRGQGKMMNITTVPSTILLKPPAQFAAVSFGISAIESFPDLVIQAAVGAKIINDSSLMASRGFNDMSIKDNMSNGISQEEVEDPKRLVDYMKRKLKGQNAKF